MSPQPWPEADEVLAAVCMVMDVAAGDMPGKTTPRTKPRLQWARNMAAFVMHDLKNSVAQLQLLVNNAAISRHYPLTETPEDEYDAILDINLNGPMLLSKAVAPAAMTHALASIRSVPRGVLTWAARNRPPAISTRSTPVW